MNGPIIPYELWPEWADRHCWDADGTGTFYGMRTAVGVWQVDHAPSKFPMPSGWDWRVPVMRQPPAPAVNDDWHLLGYAYASKQATTCAGCGEHKHTPLRIDAMGGYVCLTCIDQKLGTLLGEFGYPQPAPAVNLEQFREVVEFARHCTINKSRRDHADRLLALIDGQASVRSSSEHCSEVAGDEAITWGTQFPGKAIKLFGAREIAELNWYPDEGADLVGLRVVERVQPSKGEGE